MSSVTDVTIAVVPATTGVVSRIAVSYRATTSLGVGDAVLILDVPGTWNISGLQTAGPGVPPGPAGYEFGGSFNAKIYPFSATVIGQQLSVFGYTNDFAPETLLAGGAVGIVYINSVLGVPGAYFTNPAAATYPAADFNVATGQDGDAVHPSTAVTITSGAPAGPVNQKAAVTMGVGL